jgi:DNA-directed RNA polymerase specialized sigma24 family protein
MARRDEAAFEEFVRAHGPALLRTATLLTGDCASGADLTRNALARSWGSDSLTDVRRQLVRTHLSPLRRLTTSEQVVESVPEQRDDGAEALRTALRDLPPRVRTAVVLRYLDDLAEAEIAQLMACPVEQVRADVGEGWVAVGGLLTAPSEGSPEEHLAGRLHELADDLVGRDAAPALDAVLATYRRRRRVQAGFVATAAAVVAIAVGVPIVGHSLASAPTPHPAAPAPVTSTWSAPSPAPDHENSGAISSTSAGVVELAAMAAAERAQAQAELEAVAARLPAPTLSSPAEWDRWLPEGKPYPGASTEEDIATCPVLSDRLSAALGERITYWVGTLPGAGGCTWVPEPVQFGPDPHEYAYVLGVGFAGGGATVEDQAAGVVNGRPDRGPCPRAEVPGGGLLLRCGGVTATNDTWMLLLPDARGAGVWILSASARTAAAHPLSEAFVALVEATAGAYG